MNHPRRIGIESIGAGGERLIWCGGAIVEGGRRLPCDGEVLQVMRGGTLVTYALCARCTALEREYRQGLRAAPKATR